MAPHTNLAASRKRKALVRANVLLKVQSANLSRAAMLTSPSHIPTYNTLGMYAICWLSYYDSVYEITADGVFVDEVVGKVLAIQRENGVTVSENNYALRYITSLLIALVAQGYMTERCEIYTLTDEGLHVMQTITTAAQKSIRNMKKPLTSQQTNNIYCDYFRQCIVYKRPETNAEMRQKIQRLTEHLDECLDTHSDFASREDDSMEVDEPIAGPSHLTSTPARAPTLTSASLPTPHTNSRPDSSFVLNRNPAAPTMLSPRLTTNCTATPLNTQASFHHSYPSPESPSESSSRYKSGTHPPPSPTPLSRQNSTFSNHRGSFSYRPAGGSNGAAQQLKGTIDDLTAERNGQVSKEDENRETIDRLTAQCRERNKQVLDLEKELREMQDAQTWYDDAVDAFGRSREERIDELQDKLRVVQTFRDAYLEEMKTLKAENASLHDDLRRLTGVVRECDATIQSLREENASLQANNTELTTDIKDLVKQDEARIRQEDQRRRDTERLRGKYS